MNQDLQKALWAAADKLRSNMDAAEYKHVVLGLIFLKYIADAFDERKRELAAAFADPKHDLYLGNDSGLLGGEPLTAVDRRQLDSTLQFLDATPAEVAGAATLDDKMRLLRDLIARQRVRHRLPSPAGPVLDAGLFRAVWKDSPLNVNGSD